MRAVDTIFSKEANIFKEFLNQLFLCRTCDEMQYRHFDLFYQGARSAPFKKVYLFRRHHRDSRFFEILSLRALSNLIR